MLLSQCIRATGGQLFNGDCEFNRLSTDTRKINVGDLFIALRGPNFDAHEFLPQAGAAGACGLVVEHVDARVTLPQLVVTDTTRALGAIANIKRHDFRGTLIAVTGSSGKTTVKGMLMAILAESGAVTATRGNYNNHIGVPLTLMSIQANDQFAVIEMGTSGVGEIAYLAKLAEPDVALVNNVMPAHLEGLGSLQGVAEEKSQIYAALQTTGHAIINLDDQFAPFFIERTVASQRWGFSLQQPEVRIPDMSVIYAAHVHEDAAGRNSFELITESGTAAVDLAVLGRHNVANALAAAACALAAGVGLTDVGRGLANYASEAGRMQVVQTALSGVTLIDDTYNANPGSVRAAIDYLAARPHRKIFVLGNLAELGDDAAREHAQIGSYAQQKGVDVLLTCGELAQHASVAFGEQAKHFAAQEALVNFLRTATPASAIVLIKGSRSSHMEKIVAAFDQAGEQH